MKKLIVFVTALFWVFTSFGQIIIEDSTEVKGTWILEHSPYIVMGLATVPEEDSLIIEPGVTVEFKTGTDIRHSGDNDTVDVGYLKVLGKLMAQGTPEHRITFTRQGDDGYWGCIIITSAQNSLFEYCEIEYANHLNYYEGALNIYTPKTILLNTSVVYNKNTGIYTRHVYQEELTNDGSTLDILNCIIADNQGLGLNLGYYYDRYDTINLINNTIVGNSSVGLATWGARCKAINCIFWDNSRSFRLVNARTIVSCSLVQEESLDGVDRLTVCEGMIYMCDPHVNNDFSLSFYSPCINSGVPDTTGLSLPDKDILGNSRINLGRIDLGATESTSEGFLTILKPNGYEGYQPGNNLDIIWKSNVTNVKLEYTSDGGETWGDIVSDTPNDSLYSWGIPDIVSDSFNIRISDVSDASVFDVCDHNLKIFKSVIPDSTILTGRLPYEYSPYYVNGKLTIPLEDSLIIDPGIELKFTSHASFSVKGKLIAIGSSEEPITFTAQETDEYWWGIDLLNTGVNSSLEYCNIHYASTAITSNNPNPLFPHLIITHNYGSGIYAKESSPEIRNCIIAFNHDRGIYLGEDHWGYTIKISNSSIVGNGDEGLEAYRAKCEVTDCIFWNNKKSFYVSGDNADVSYSLVEEDILPDYYGRLIAGEGMIYHFDPQFVDSDNLDFHLKPTSPGIDQGDPDSDWSNEPEENGDRVNLGAYGNTNEATQTNYLPRITNLSAREESIFGKDTLIINGANFLAEKGNGVILFGTSEVLEYLYWSQDSLVCITPPHLSDTVSIFVTNKNQKNGFGKKCYVYKPPIIKNLSRYSGLPSGGDTLIIEGVFFGHEKRQTAIRFDDQLCTHYINWTDTLITLTTPPNTSGIRQIIFEQDTLVYESGVSFVYSDMAPVELCGSLEDTLYAGGIYLLTCKCEVDSGKVLTIEPGVLLIADHYQPEKPRLTVTGKLHAVGSQGDSVRFMTMVPGKNNWDGIYVQDSATFNYVVIQNCEFAVNQSNGYLNVSNSSLRENETGIFLYGDNERIYIYLNRNKISNNNTGIRAEASGNKSYGKAELMIENSSISYNDGNGIELSGHGYTSSGWIPQSRSSTVLCTLKNSVIAKNEGYALYLYSYGFTFSAIPVSGIRSAYVGLNSYNNLVFQNRYGIYSKRAGTKSRVHTEFYNTNFWSNNTLFEMDADEVFFYNSNLWDNNASGMPTGLCDSLIFESCNLNDLSSVINGSNNISEDPLYRSPESGDFRLGPNSPCIDAGSNQFIDFITDFSGMSRIWDGDSDGEEIVDIGAFEKDSESPLAPEIIQQPQGGSYCQNSLAELSVDATGIPKPDYQWFFEGKLIKGANEKKYIIENVNDTTAGMYTCLVSNLSGSEGSSEAIVEVLPTYEIILYETVCEGDSCKGWTEAGTYTETLTSVSGCDSTVVTHLSVNPVYEITEDIMICEGEEYNGWTESGTYYDTLTTLTGCDSIITTILTVHPIYQITVDTTLCEGESYKGWTTTGQYTENLVSVNGCDSIIITNLTVYPSFKPTFSINGDTLTSDEIYAAYQWYDENGEISGATNQEFVINQSGNYYLEATNENGCCYSSDTFYVRYSVLDEIVQNDFSYSVMPNPNRGVFTFRIDSNPPEKLSVKLINGLGQVMEIREIKNPEVNQTEQFNVSYLSKGIYHFIIYSDNFWEERKIVVQ